VPELIWAAKNSTSASNRPNRAHDGDCPGGFAGIAYVDSSFTKPSKSAFFFEKKKQKTFASLSRLYAQHTTLRHKSFLVLFFKKERLPPNGAGP
jgi:hypothetical protein